MSTDPVPQASVVRERRRSKRPKGWAAIPTAVKILVPLCLMILILGPAAWRHSRLRRDASRDAARNAINWQGGASGPLRSDLVLSEAMRDRQSHTIKGVVANRSATEYRDVQVSYNVFGPKGWIEVITAVVPRIGAHESARFETNAMPPEGQEWVLREVAGTPK